MTDGDNDLRRSLLDNASDEDFNKIDVGPQSDGRIFGLTAVERMILSIVLFLAVSVLGVALLFITSTIVIR